MSFMCACVFVRCDIALIPILIMLNCFCVCVSLYFCVHHEDIVNVLLATNNKWQQQLPESAAATTTPAVAAAAAAVSNTSTLGPN